MAQSFGSGESDEEQELENLTSAEALEKLEEVGVADFDHHHVTAIIVSL